MKRIPFWPLLLAALAACGGDSPSEPKPPVPPTPPPPTNPAGVQVGDLFTLNVQSGDGRACTNPDNRVGRVSAISQHSIIVHDTANPAGGFTQADYQQLGTRFDNLVYPVVVNNFGTPADLDNNGRVIVFYTRAVNELTPSGQDFYVGGFFFARDLFPKQDSPGFQGCPGSNSAELFYMLAPDPSGIVNGNARTKDFVLGVTVGVLAHEFQHLVNASRRLHILKVSGSAWNEVAWLNEGLSHIAEELLGHAAGGTSPRQNIDAQQITSSAPLLEAFNEYHIANFGRLNSYLAKPDTASPIAEDQLSTRGAAWQLLRYSADRRTGTDAQFWRGLVDSDKTGLANFQQSIGNPPLDWMQDWFISTYSDDAGISGVEAIYTEPSWNFRSILPALRVNNGRYPLPTLLLANGTATATIRGGSGTVMRFGVAAGTQGSILLESTAVGCGGGSAPIQLTVGQVFKAAGDAAAGVCVAGGSTGGEFVYIPFFASESGTATLALSVTAANVTGVAGPPNPALLPSGSAFTAAVEMPRLKQDRRWEMGLRQQEMRELGPRVGAPAALQSVGPAEAVPAFNASSAAVDSRLRIAIMRTK